MRSLELYTYSSRITLMLCTRIVRNDSVSRPLSKGILDGNLLGSFEDLPIPRQIETTQPIGIDRLSVLKDWTALGGPW